MLTRHEKVLLRRCIDRIRDRHAAGQPDVSDERAGRGTISYSWSGVCFEVGRGRDAFEVEFVEAFEGRLSCFCGAL